MEYEALLPYFRRSEEQERGESRQHGVGGPIAVSDGRYVSDLSRAFVAGCEEIGIPPTDDFNGPRCDGAGFFQVTQRRGRRSGTRDYLTRTAGGSRVSLHLRSRAVRLVIEDGRVRGVDVVSDGKRRRLYARRETILCAGVVRSPQLLMLSGIGSAEALTRLGIRVQVDNPGVGANLQDHVRIPVIREWGGDRPSRPLGLVGAGLRYLWSRRGLLTSNVCDAAAIVKPDNASVPSLRIVCQWRALPEARQACVNFEVVLIDPCSRGQVSLASDDPDAAMRIDPSYLRDSRDLARLVHGVELARAIAESGPCRQAGVGLEMLPGSESVADYARRQANSAYHHVGTCCLGTTASADVDPHLRVIGIRGLRVADASVMPTTVAGNAQAAVFAIAERAADLIRDE